MMLRRFYKTRRTLFPLQVWADMKIDYAKYKEVYFKIRSTEDLFQSLEDHSVNVSSMKSSPYYPAFSTDLDAWEKTLALISEIIDLQLGVQRQWMYLESIVSAFWACMLTHGQPRHAALPSCCSSWRRRTCARCSPPRPASSTA